MKSSIFDLIQKEPKTGHDGYFELAETAPMPKEKSYVKKAKGYGKSVLKGAAEGLHQLGRIMGPTGVPQKTEEVSEELNKLLPTDNEDFGQRSLRRGLKEAPTFLSFPGVAKNLTNLPRPLVAGFLGEGAKDLGLPEWAQSAAELTAYIGPDITQKLLSSGKNRELIAVAKKYGMSDEQITPLIQSEFKEKWLSKLVPKRGATQKALKESKAGLSKFYEGIQSSKEAERMLGEASKLQLQEKLSEALFKMPSSVRAKIGKDIEDLYNNPITGQSLMNFYADINHNLGKGSKQLSLLKEPVKEAISSLSPELGKDFELVNKLYSKYSTIASRLKPTLSSDILGALETAGIVGTLVTGNFPILGKIIGEKAARKIAQQMIINPRFQQLGKKMVVAINENKFALAEKLVDEFSKLASKDDKELQKKLKEASDEELEEIFR